MVIPNSVRWVKSDSHSSPARCEQAKRMKALEKENTRLRHVVAELALEKQILKDVAEGNF
jgi:hypothetical protein